NTPLIMAVRGEIEPSPPYLLAHSTASEMQLDQHYHYDHRETRIDMTEEGYAFAMKALQQSGIRSLARPWARYVSNALRAIVVLRLDDDYIIGPHEGKTKVQIVDKFTGRILPERTWSDGLHQAVEVKENLPNSEPNDTNASISRQRYFPLYDSMCGMTGTALGSEREFRDFYGLHVTNIPTNRPNILSVAKPRYFVDTASKLDAVATDVQHRHQDRQPILIGTRTIASSKQVAQVLEQRGLAVTILNGVQDAEEAEIVAGAGNPDSILIATNMAGRGTDIKLKPAAKDAGGLHVIVLEHHESQRVDRQLIGRAARQGNPGSYQYMISAEDEVLVRYGPTLADSMQRSAQATGESKRCFAADIDRLQSKVQKQFYKQRQQMVDRDKWNDHVLNRFWNETTN
ncbi:MAG: helicase-related protein, partial [Planctomycetota bacterium]